MKKLTAIVLSCLMLLSLCACGNSAKQSAPSSAAYENVSYEASAPAAAGGFRDAYYESADEAWVEEPAEAPIPAPESSAPESAEKPSDSELNVEKIIYSASVSVETTEFDDALGKVDELVERCGGFVESSSLNGSNYYSQARGYAPTRSATYTLRIPSEHFNELMNSLSELGNVPYSHTYSDNITAQYYDVDARLTAYRTQETRLLEMMEQAETVSDLIEIEDRLAELRYRIESLQSTLKNWDRQVSYSTVSLTISEVTVYTPAEEPGFFAELWESVKNGFYSAGELLKGLVELLVTLLPLIVIALILWLILRPAIKKRRAAKKAKKEAAKAAGEQKKSEA